MNNLFSTARNGVLITGLFFSSLHSQSLEEWVINNPLKSFVVATAAIYGVYCGVLKICKKSPKKKENRYHAVARVHKNVNKTGSAARIKGHDKKDVVNNINQSDNAGILEECCDPMSDTLYDVDDNIFINEIVE